MSATKRCCSCGVEYPATTEYFYRSGKGLHTECKPCARERARIWRSANPDRALKQHKAWAKEHPEAIREIRRRYHANVRLRKKQEKVGQ